MFVVDTRRQRRRRATDAMTVPMPTGNIDAQPLTFLGVRHQTVTVAPVIRTVTHVHHARLMILDVVQLGNASVEGPARLQQFARVTFVRTSSARPHL